MKGYQRSLLIDESPLQVLPQLAKSIGLNEAIILQQIHYWLNRSDNVRGGRRYVYKTAQGWAEEFPFWSEATIRRAIATLRGLGLVVVEKESTTSWNRTNWYSLNYEALNSLNVGIESGCADASAQIDQMHAGKLSESNRSTCADQSAQCDQITNRTETTSETTTKSPARRPGVDYVPSESVLAWVKANGFEPYLQLHVEQFRDTCETQARKPYKPTGLDAAFRKCCREDWGKVRQQAQMNARYGQQLPGVPAKKRVCAYCPAPSTGMTNGREHCREHTDDAMENRAPQQARATT